jgi:hypothetical protein
MTLLLAFFYSSVLAVGGVGAWALRRPSSPGTSLARWILVGFPLALVGVSLLKPHGPSFWLGRMTKPDVRERLTLLAILVFVTIRGARRIVDVVVGWAQLLHQSIPGDSLAEAPWLGFRHMCLRAGVSAPEIRFHHELHCPIVVGWHFPVILFPGRLVPMACRTPDPFWDGLEETNGNEAMVRAMLVHELEHIRRRDHWKLALLVLNGIVLPWEWVDGQYRQGLRNQARKRPIRWATQLLSVLGRPYRSGVAAERRIQENLADGAVRAGMADGAAILERVRGPASPVQSGDRPCKEAPWRPLVFTLVTGGLLGMAPGSVAIRYAWEGKMTQLLDLPPSWSLALEPGFGKASTGLLPGEGGEPGKILVRIEDLVPGHLPQLIGAGYFNLSECADAGWIEMTWDIVMDGPLPDPEGLFLLIAAFRMVLDTRQDAVSFEAEAAVPPEPLGGNTYRFHRRIALGGVRSGSFWIYLRYVFQREGKWTFDPPVLELVAPDGTRRPFPSA